MYQIYKHVPQQIDLSTIKAMQETLPEEPGPFKQNYSKFKSVMSDCTLVPETAHKSISPEREFQRFKRLTRKIISHRTNSHTSPARCPFVNVKQSTKRIYRNNQVKSFSPSNIKQEKQVASSYISNHKVPSDTHQSHLTSHKPSQVKQTLQLMSDRIRSLVFTCHQPPSIEHHD